MKIDLQGIKILSNPDWSRTFTIFAFGDICLPDIEATLRGCALARSYGKIIALPPKIPGAHPGDLGAISWNPQGKFASAVRDILLDGCRKMGGQLPPELTTKQQTGVNAARRFAQKPAAAQEEDRPAADDCEAIEGLHRTLGICAETMEAV